MHKGVFSCPKIAKILVDYFFSTPKGGVYHSIVNEICKQKTILTVNNTETKLTEREIAILKMVAEGRTSAQIANSLSLCVETIKWYRKRLLQKTESSNSAEMIKKASEAGLL